VNEKVVEKNMAKSVRRATPSEIETPIVPRAVLSAIDETVRKDFSRLLYRFMMAKNWNQSKLAMETFGDTEDGRGYKVAKGRDLVSKYLRGVTFPDNKTLVKLAKALGIEASELLPASLKALIMRDDNVSMMQPLGNGLTRIAFNQITTNEAATKIYAILSEAEATANTIMDKTFNKRAR